MSIPIFTVDNAPVDVLRQWYKEAMQRADEAREWRRLGWWVMHHASAITITTKDGATITTTPERAIDAIEHHNRYLADENRRRAA
jgi:hypothetical protein